MLSASIYSLEGINMTPSSPALGKGENIFMHDMHKLAVDLALIQMTAKKFIKKHGDIEVATAYK